MDKFRCPACGARGYRGGRCGECRYVPFNEEIAHGNHYHMGEPLVLKTPPKVTRPGNGCDSYAGERTPRIPKGLIKGLVIAGCLLLGFVSPVLLVFAAIAWSAYKSQKNKKR